MEIIKDLTETNFTKGKNKKNEYIVIHYVGALGNAKNNATYFKKEYRGASANYFVDEENIVQVVEDDDIAWHCGAKKYYNNCRNNNSIGIEMCCFKNGNTLDISTKVEERTKELTKELMKKYNIPVENVVRHYDVTRKVCPAPFVNNESRWVNFKKSLEEANEMAVIKRLIDEYGEENVEKAFQKLMESENNNGEPSNWAKEDFEKAIADGITDGSKPQSFATRQEVAIMVDRAYQNSNKK